VAGWFFFKEHIMAFVRVEQRNARLATAVRIEFVKGRDGEVAKGIVTVISNSRRGAGEDRVEEATAIQWTLWGKQAENAAEYLGKGSRVNVVGRLQSNNYDKDGATVYGFQFTCEELDYLDSRLDADARRGRQEGARDDEPAPTQQPTQSAPRGRNGRSAGRAAAPGQQ
jgi:single-strand DNA-binding protein